jgi:hypothetical protein
MMRLIKLGAHNRYSRMATSSVYCSLMGPRSHMQNPRNLRKLSIFGQEKQKETVL